MKSLNAKLVFSALSVALLAAPALAQRPQYQPAVAAPSNDVVVRGHVVGADPDANIRAALLREWDSLHGE